MLTIIRKIWDALTSDVIAVAHRILKLIAAIWSFFDHAISRLWHAAAELWKALTAFSRSIRKWAAGVIHAITWIVDKLIPKVVKWVLKLFNSVLKYATKLAKWVSGWIDRLIKDIQKAIVDVTQWAIQNIWNPLFNAITLAWHWITHEGAYVFDIITHPEKLIAILGKWLWMSWLDLIRKFSRPIAKWLLHEMIKMPDELANVLDILISSLL